MLFHERKTIKKFFEIEKFNGFSACFVAGAIVLLLSSWTFYFLPSEKQCDITDYSSISDAYVSESSTSGSATNSQDPNKDSAGEAVGSNENAAYGEEGQSDRNSSVEDQSQSGDTRKGSSNNSGVSGNSGSSSNSSDSGNPNPSTPNRRWVPDKTQVIHHPAETTNVKHYQVTCMCETVFTGHNLPAAVAAWQNHRPNP